MRNGPLSNSYPGAVALVVCSLIPYLALTAGVFPLSDVISKSVHLSSSTFDITIALSTGGYAVGTVLALQLATHLRPRRMLVIYEALFVVASVLSAWAPTGAIFMTGFILQGLCTSLMLIAAVPPLVTSWPPSKMPVTGGIMNLCIFGAVAAGPTIGALQLTGDSWRPLFWGVAGVAAVAFVLSLLTFEDEGPVNRDAPWDLVAVGTATVGCGAAFYGAGQLQASLTDDVQSLVPLCAGTALIVALVVHQYRMRKPLMPVRAAATTTPVTGIYIALTTSAAAFGLMELILQLLHQRSTPTDTAVLFLPEFVAAIAVAGLFGALFRTRYTPVLALGGLLMVVAAGALFLVYLPSSGVLLAAVAGMLGLGVAASVSPALFMAGFSLPSKLLQPVFAMIELMRGVTAFLVAPVLIYLSEVLSRQPSTGMGLATWICIGIAGIGFVGGLALYLSGRPYLVAPDLDAWQGGSGEDPAWESPPLLSALRGRRPEQQPGAPAQEAGDRRRAG